MVIFPLAANMASASPTGAAIGVSGYSLSLEVDIPCPGHAPLISEGLKTIEGVNYVKFRFPNYFDVEFDGSVTDKDEILSLAEFDYYPAKIIAEDVKVDREDAVATNTGCSVCGGCSGACGGTCGDKLI